MGKTIQAHRGGRQVMGMKFAMKCPHIIWRDRGDHQIGMCGLEGGEKTACLCQLQCLSGEEGGP